MEFLHSREYLGPDDYVEVNCDTKCNVMLTTDSDFSNFKGRRDYDYYGGYRTHFPTRLKPPYAGYWNITIDVGEGYHANIKYSITVVKGG